MWPVTAIVKDQDVAAVAQLPRDGIVDVAPQA